MDASMAASCAFLRASVLPAMLCAPDAQKDAADNRKHHKRNRHGNQESVMPEVSRFFSSRFLRTVR